MAVLLYKVASKAAEDSFDAPHRHHAVPALVVDAPDGAEKVRRALRLGRRRAASLELNVIVDINDEERLDEHLSRRYPRGSAPVLAATTLRRRDVLCLAQKQVQ